MLPEKSPGQVQAPQPDPTGTVKCRAAGDQHVNYARCTGITSTPARNGSVCSDCNSKWRLCRRCIVQNEGGKSAWVVNHKTGLCQFHEENGEGASRPKAPVPKGVSTRPSASATLPTYQRSPQRPPSSSSATPPPALKKGPPSQTAPIAPVARRASPAIAEAAVSAVPGTLSAPQERAVVSHLPERVAPAPPPTLATPHEQKAEKTTNGHVVSQTDRRWPTVGESGLVPIRALVRDPDQPRQYFSEAELRILVQSIKAGGQREVVTVRELTEVERSSDISPTEARYLIVSGERRWRGGQLAGQAFIEIRVKEYASRGAQMLDAWILNEDRVDLSDLEIALYIPKMAAENGWITQAEIQEGMRRNSQWVSDHLSILKLIPEFQDRMHPRIAKNDRMKINAASFIARLEPDIQLTLAKSMPPELKAASRQLAWIKRELLRRGTHVTTRIRNPHKLRMRVGTLTETFASTIDNMYFAPDLAHIFSNASDDQIKSTVAHIIKAGALLDTFKKRLMELGHERTLQLKSGSKS